MKRIIRTLATLALSLAVLSGCSSSDGSGASSTPDAGPTGDAPGPGECAAGRSACDGLCVDEQTDNGNCGGCGVSCPTGCNAGRCTTALASGLGAPAALALDANRLYWTDPSLGVVAAAPVTGGAPITLASSQADPGLIAVAGSSVYWSTPGAIMMAPVDGGTATPLMKLPANAPGVTQLITAAGLVFAVTPAGYVGASSPDSQPESLAPFGPPALGRIAYTSTQMFWTSDMSAPGADDGELVVQPNAGTERATALAAHLGNCRALALGPHGVYWADNTLGRILTVPAGGGTVVTLATGQSAPDSIAVDDTGVYWTNSGDRTLMKVALKGGKPETVARSTSVIAGMVVDGTSVYWTQVSDAAGQTPGMVMKTTPK